jgi:hypothetical protein
MATSLRNTVAARTTPKSIAKATKANGRLIVPPFLEPLYSLARLHRPGRDRGWGRTGARNGEHVDKVPIEKALVSTASLQGDSANEIVQLSGVGPPLSSTVNFQTSPLAGGAPTVTLKSLNTPEIGIFS